WHYLLLARVIGTLVFLTKIPGLIVGLPMAYAILAILKDQPTRRMKNLIALSVFAIFTLTPVIAYYLWARHLALSYPPYHFAGAGNWLWHDGFKQWWDQSYFLPKLSQRFNGWIWTAPVIALVSFGLLFRPRLEACNQGSVNDQQSRNKSTKVLWLFHWWLIAGVIYYLI